MQPATTLKKKYNIEDYISPNRANPMIRNSANPAASESATVSPLRS